LPPLKAFGSHAGFQAGVHGAVATMGAVFARLRSGKGQHVEVSAQESLVSQNEMVFEYWPYMDVIATRLGRKPLQPLETMQCKDGWIYICCVEEHQWRSFVALMGNPEWADEEIFADRLKRGENWEALEIFLREWVGEQRKLSGRLPRRYPTIEDAFKRMQEENKHLSAEQARHLTEQGVNQNEDGTYSWKFDNYVRVNPPYDMTYAAIESLWAQIVCPTLLVYGKESWASNPEEDGRIRHFGDARVVSFEGAGHWVHHDRLDGFLELLRGFL